jgi:UDP-N-acetylmuramyl pentapeptide phosphotransferase/UDP-N-acetylglucosamine-1-phosphate transferase
VVEVFLYPTIFLLSYYGVEAFRRWSLRRKLFDIPNERSSHTTPTPRGGGLVIVLIGLTAYTVYAVFIAGDFAWSYVLGAMLIAGISWLDDLYSVSFVWRFLVHALAAVLVINYVGYFGESYIPFFQTAKKGDIAGVTVTFLWIVWLTNAYNFMDGIDGIAGMQAVTAGIGWLVVGNLLGSGSVEFYGGVLASSSLGFLMQNWQPARIFMGDVGSAFLGFSFAVLPLLAGREMGAASENRRFLPIAAVALVWLFVFDTVYTFFRRAANAEKVWEAHREHLYQKFVAAGFSHRLTAGLYGLISILTVSATILWIGLRGAWLPLLIFLIGFQAILLLIALPIVRRKKRRVV